jgi:hypothetical protein
MLYKLPGSHHQNFCSELVSYCVPLSLPVLKVLPRASVSKSASRYLSAYWRSSFGCRAPRASLPKRLSVTFQFISPAEHHGDAQEAHESYRCWHAQDKHSVDNISLTRARLHAVRLFHAARKRIPPSVEPHAEVEVPGKSASTRQRAVGSPDRRLRRECYKACLFHSFEGKG